MCLHVACLFVHVSVLREDTLILAREAPRDEGLDLDEMEEQSCLVLSPLLSNYMLTKRSWC